MIQVALKYEMFGESPKAMEALQQFLRNYEMIQVSLGKIEESLIEPHSTLDENAKEIERINGIIKKLSSKKNVVWNV